MNQRLETILKLLPYSTAFVIICGIIKAMCYYAVFGIRIVPYLEFDECIFLFLDQFILSFLTGCLIVYSALNSNNGSSNQGTPLTKKQNWMATILLIGLITFLIISVVRTGILVFILSTYWTFIGSLTTILAFTVNYIHNRYKKFTNQTLRYPILFLMTLGIYLLIISATGGLYNGAAKLKQPKSRREAKLMFQDSLMLTTNDTLMYVGRTKNYTIMYDLKTDATKIISNSQIKELDIK